MKTTFVVGLMAVTAMNLVACIPGMDVMGCAAADPETDFNVAPLAFTATTTTETCDAARGVVLDLTDAQGSSIHVVVQPNVLLGTSMPLTADSATATGPVRASSTADGLAKVTLTDAEYNELPNNWSNAAIELNAVPFAGGSTRLSGNVQFYFADGRALAVPFDQAPATACPVPVDPQAN